MRLLVSVTDAFEAGEALSGGAQIIDAKDPSRGALGAVGLDVFEEIVAAVGRRATVSAALGDARDEREIERVAAGFAECGAGFVKVGFANVSDPSRVAMLLAAVVRGALRGGRECGVVAVGYADASRVGAIEPWALLRVAADCGVTGVLVDTADKAGPGLMGLWSVEQLGAWVDAVRAAGLVASVAGKITVGDISSVAQAGADIVGVRGAACNGGRAGRVSAERVRELVSRSGRLRFLASAAARLRSE